MPEGNFTAVVRVQDQFGQEALCYLKQIKFARLSKF